MENTTNIITQLRNVLDEKANILLNMDIETPILPLTKFDIAINFFNQYFWCFFLGVMILYIILVVWVFKTSKKQNRKLDSIETAIIGYMGFVIMSGLFALRYNFSITPIILLAVFINFYLIFCKYNKPKRRKQKKG